MRAQGDPTDGALSTNVRNRPGPLLAPRLARVGLRATARVGARWPMTLFELQALARTPLSRHYPALRQDRPEHAVQPRRPLPRPRPRFLPVPPRHPAQRTRPHPPARTPHRQDRHLATSRLTKSRHRNLTARLWSRFAAACPRTHRFSSQAEQSPYLPDRDRGQARVDGGADASACGDVAVCTAVPSAMVTG